VDENDKLVKTTIFTEAEALAMISGVEAEAAPVEEAEEIIEEVEAVIEEVEEVIEGVEESSDVPDYGSMTKAQLEALMREHGIELDRRKSKGDLLEQVDGYFKGYFSI